MHVALYCRDEGLRPEASAAVTTFVSWHFPMFEFEEGDEPFKVYRLAAFSEITGDFSSAFPKCVADNFGEAQNLIAATAAAI